MFLSDLEIIGFKSFGLKTKFKFSEGITCLVGPNGCGKSNIVDAIRWVLGEQKSNVLRSDNMENIIFNGTKHRKQAGIAEVILTIENNKHLLPSDFENVSVARRLNRNGDSKYLLNKANCRLKDINNLFMDTGMGPDSYSVIELKMVENLLSGRNEDRKNLLEEAAGITKYKVRRKESERKLKRVEEDLERVEDIVVEVRKNTNSLSRQAAKTKRYNKYTEELKEKEVQLYSFDIKKFSTRKQELIKILEDQNNSIKSYENILSEISEELLSKNRSKSGIEIKNKDLRIEISTIQAKLSDNSQLEAVSTVKEKNLTREIRRFDEDRKSSLESNGRKEKKVIELDKEIDTSKKTKEEISVSLDNENQKSNIINNDINSLKDELNQIGQRINNNRNRISEINYTKKRHLESVEKVNNQINELIKKLEEQKKRNTEIIDQKKNKESNLEHLKKKKEDLQKEIDSNQNKINDLSSQIAKLKDDFNEKNLKFKDLTRELNFWESSIDKSSNAGFLLSNSKWNDNYSTLAENLGIDEKFINAYGAVLNYKSDSIVLNDIQKAIEAGEILRENKKGKHNFIINQNIDEIKTIDKPENAIAIFSELPRVSDEIRNYLRKAFPSIAIVENFDVAREIIGNTEVQAAVTLSGNIITKNGEILIGGNEKSKADFGKKEKINKLKKEISSLKDAIEEIEKNINSKNKEVNSIDLSKLNTDLANNNREISELEKSISSLQIENNSIQNRIDIYSENLKNAKIEKEELDSKVISDNEISELEKSINDLENKKSEKISKLQIAEKNLSDLNRTIQTINIENVNINNKINNLENEKRNIFNSIEASKRRIAKLEKDHEKNQSELKKVLEDTKKAKENIEIFKTELEVKKTDSELLTEKIKEVNKDIEQIESNRSINQKELDKLNSQNHKTEIELTEVKTKIESILNNANEKYDLNLDNLEKIVIESEPDELRQIIKELKEKLASIGSVNFMALEDFEKENQRLIFYETQIEDLSKAKNTLLETIKEINKKAEELLTNTFEQVRKNFKELFQTLFSEEGECDIMLEGDNPLDADLAIMAKPPGKKPHSIDMLSGGEKTLTAIALLFAIYLVKPSPFCILDEVDAPLDDNNIGRFVKLIKKFSNNTQFLVVTHNKKTMEAADNLYGITQQEEGLSKIVSVQLNRNN